MIGDLTFIEDGNPDKVEDGAINWSKRTLLFSVYSQFLEIQRRASYRYPIRPTKDQLLMSIDANQLPSADVRPRGGGRAGARCERGADVGLGGSIAGGRACSCTSSLSSSSPRAARSCQSMPHARGCFAGPEPKSKKQ